jgi:hypothetical protein
MNHSFSELMAAGAVGIALFTMGPQLLDAEQGPLVCLEQGDAGLDLELPSQ